MAYLKIVKKGHYTNKNAVRNVIHYITDSTKTPSGYIGAIGCSATPDTAIQDFEALKEVYDKQASKEIVHMIISFTDEEYLQMTSAGIYAYAYQAAAIIGAQYYTIFACHETQEQPHIHFAINTLNYRNGNCYTYPLSGEEQMFIQMLSVLGIPFENKKQT